MAVFATFDAHGLPTGFYPEDVFPSAEGARNAAVPAAAVEISDADHRALIATPGAASWDGKAVVPYAAAVDLGALAAALAADIDRQAEAQRLRYVTPGEAQMATYLLKRGQALSAIANQAADAAANRTADQIAAAYPYLANEIGLTLDPSSKAPAADVYGVARAIAAVAAAWQTLDLAIERTRLATKAAIASATSAPAAQAAHDAATWPKSG